MKNAIVLLVHLLTGLAVLLGTGGTRAILAENILLKRQLLVLQRSRRRAPNFRTADRLLFGFCSQFLSPRRLIRTAIILKPATLLRFHRGFKDFKYRFLYSSSPKTKPGPKGPSPGLVRAICELKARNSQFGCPKIALQLAKTFGLDLDKDVVRRVLAAHYRPERRDHGPSWLTLLGHTKDSLWSLDLFRTESILLRSHWVLVVMDQFTRGIIGFGVQAIAVDGPGLCRLFNQAISGHGLPTRLSTDHDPLFQFHRWQANLRILDVERVQTVPQVPWSHPFIERLVATLRREYLDRLFFGPLRTWSANWSRSKITTTRLAPIKVYPATRLMRKPVLQHPRQPALRITAGKAIALGCLNFQLQPEQ